MMSSQAEQGPVIFAGLPGQESHVNVAGIFG